MFLIIITFLLCIHVTAYTAEETKSNTPLLSDQTVTIQFDMNNGIKVEYPREYVQNSITLKSMLDDLGQTDAAIPMNIDKPVFDCMMELIKPEPIDPMKLPFTTLQTNFKLKMNNYATIKPLDLLLAANYLDLPIKIKKAIAPLYVEVIKKKAPEIRKSRGMVFFDELPQDLESIVAGALLADLLKNKPWKDETIEAKPFGITQVMFTATLS